MPSQERERSALEHPLDAETRLVALLGDPVAHSWSPQLHNPAFRHQGLNWAYVALRVEAEELGAAVEGLRALRFAGANVTIPHKEAVMPLLDEHAERADAVGAVNTIIVKREEDGARLRGDNTDVVGFLDPLHEYAERVRGAEGVILGAGGAARAAAYALLSTFAPRRLTLAARRVEQADRLARDLAPYDERDALSTVPLSEAEQAVRQGQLLVNATPLGMAPHTDETPWPHANDFSPEHIVYDLVYTPAQTRFLKEAAARSATTIGGQEMLVGQAAAAYRQWTGEAMPTDVVQRALRDIAH